MGRIPADIHRVTTAILPDDPRIRVRRSDTLLIDLRQDEEALFTGMNETNRQTARKGPEDGLLCTCDMDCAPAVIDAFCTYYDAFAKARDLHPVFRRRLELLAAQHRLALTHVAFADGTALAWHAYHCAPERVVLLYSASHFRQMKENPRSKAIMRANRVLHWNDLLAFRRLGIPLYDWGGLDTTAKSEQTTKIAGFKTGFGGAVAPVYAYTVPLSLTGKIACAVLAKMGANY